MTKNINENFLPLYKNLFIFTETKWDEMRFFSFWCFVVLFWCVLKKTILDIFSNVNFHYKMVIFRGI